MSKVSKVRSELEIFKDLFKNGMQPKIDNLGSSAALTDVVNKVNSILATLRAAGIIASK